MKITVTFDSLEEFVQHFSPASQAVVLAEVHGTEPEVPEYKEEAPMPEPEEKAPEPEPEEKGPSVEDVRKALADLNKAAGKNVAKDLIKEIGYKKLTEVPPEKLPDLQALIEEKGKTYA